MSTENIQIFTKKGAELNVNEWISVEKLIKQFTSGLNDNHNKEYLINKLVKNPLGECFVTVAIDDKECIGFSSFTKKKIFIKNKIYESYEYGDVYVNTRWQGKFIFSKIIRNGLDKVNKDKNNFFVYGTPNKNSLPWFIRNGFSLVDFHLYAFILPIKTYLYFENRLLKIFFRIINSIYIIVIKLIMFLYSFNEKIIIKKNKKMNFNNLNILDKHDIYLIKDKKYKEWRYKFNVNEYIKYDVLDKNNNIIGEFIFREIMLNNEKCLSIVDFQIDNKHFNRLHNILSKILNTKFDIHKYKYIYTWISIQSLQSKYLKKILPFRHQKIKFIVLNNNKKELLNISDLKINFMIGDGDNI